MYDYVHPQFLILINHWKWKLPNSEQNYKLIDPKAAGVDFLK